MPDETVDTLWIAGQPFLAARFYRQANASPIMQFPAKILVDTWAISFGFAQRELDRSLQQGGIVSVSDVWLYHVRGGRLLNNGLELGQQGLADNDVLVFLHGDESTVSILAAMVAQTRGFPKSIPADLPPHMQSFTLQELDERERRSMSITNNVTIHVAEGATFTGPVAVGQTITQTYQIAKSTNNDELGNKLTSLTLAANSLIEAMKSEKEQNDTARHLSRFVEDAKDDVPDRTTLDFEANWLISAANKATELAGPVISAVKAVLSILFPGSGLA